MKTWRIIWAAFCVIFFTFGTAAAMYIWYYNNGCGTRELICGSLVYLAFGFFAWGVIDRPMRNNN